MGITEIVIVGTLHQLHSQVRGYGFKDLSDLLEELKPSALVVELQESEIQDLSVPVRGSKVEYNEAIIPTAKALRIPMYPLEPSGQVREEILKIYNSAWDRAKASPSYEAFSTYVDVLIAQLLSYWSSALDVNSEITIENFRLKHSYQDKLLSVDTPSWHQWNEKFLESVIRVAGFFQGKRIVITVGAEHVYWLQDRLKPQKGIRLVPLSSAIVSR